jgi:hypothetical protein
MHPPPLPFGGADYPVQNTTTLKTMIRNVEILEFQKRELAQYRVSVVPIRVDRVLSVCIVLPDLIRNHLKLGALGMNTMLPQNLLQTKDIDFMGFDLILQLLENHSLIEE